MAALTPTGSSSGPGPSGATTRSRHPSRSLGSCLGGVAPTQPHPVSPSPSGPPALTGGQRPVTTHRELVQSHGPPRCAYPAGSPSQAAPPRTPGTLAGTSPSGHRSPSRQMTPQCPCPTTQAAQLSAGSRLPPSPTRDGPQLGPSSQPWLQVQSCALGWPSLDLKHLMEMLSSFLKQSHGH